MDSSSSNLCPWLPRIEGVLDFTVTRRHGEDRGPAFYRDALRYAQSQWSVGKPAQAILQLDKAFMADLGPDDHWLTGDMDPYGALAWMLGEIDAGREGFAGNPVRHFQHLASRMSGPRPAVRRWRAWACLHLAEKILPAAGYERDGLQLVREGLWVPGRGPALAGLHQYGWPGEADHVAQLLEF